MPSRRQALQSGLASCALLLASRSVGTQGLPLDARTHAAFSPAMLRDTARMLAERPHRAAEAALPRALDRLDYDGYRKIRFDAARALWAAENLPFRVQPHHRGFIFKDRVDLFEVANGEARPLAYDATAFRFEGIDAPADPGLGFAGFRITHPLNRADHFDELCSFLGASYFRALGQGHAWGVSARGLAVGTADPRGEEFPRFSAFWLERPAPGATTLGLHALLESPSVTGAFHVVVQPGPATIMEVDATLFPRRAIARIGIAPGTSMFKFAPQDRVRVDDWRPAVHDSDGLQMQTGAGEALWRPLTNPRTLQVSGFQDRAPRGFGLMQRNRNFHDHQDLEAEYHRRPGLWVEPLEDWGEGEVQLVEIPTDSEIHDNIVAAWCPRGGLAAGQPRRLRYRLHWTSGVAPALPAFTATRQGVAGEDARRFVLDTAAMDIAGVTPRVTASSGVVRHVTLQRNPATGGARLAFELSRPGALAELRAVLLRGEAAASETWLHRWAA